MFAQPERLRDFIKDTSMIPIWIMERLMSELDAKEAEYEDFSLEMDGNSSGEIILFPMWNPIQFKPANASNTRHFTLKNCLVIICRFFTEQLHPHCQPKGQAFEIILGRTYEDDPLIWVEMLYRIGYANHSSEGFFRTLEIGRGRSAKISCSNPNEVTKISQTIAALTSVITPYVEERLA